MDPLITISALIYANPRYAWNLWQMLRRTTPELEDGRAEFFFVANDATAEVLWHLQSNGIPHVVQENPRLSEQELFELGIARPEYVRRVYQGWNRAIHEARSKILVLLSSDHVMRDGWLDKLYKKWNPNLALSTLTIEPPNSRGKIFGKHLGRGTGAVLGKHGRTISEFNEVSFNAHAADIECEKITAGGAHQPTMFSVPALLKAGLYPEGNIHAGTFEKIKECGDRRLFRLLAKNGVEHRTYHGTVAYHFQEGEMRDPERP